MNRNVEEVTGVVAATFHIARLVAPAFEEALKEVIPLDAKTAKQLPKDLVGWVLKQREAMKLIERLG